MNSIDFSPLYRSSIGFDRLASLLDNALRTDNGSGGYPPYNIEVLGDNKYGITLAVAGFDRNELEIQVEQGVLTVRGRKAANDDTQRKFLYQGIANRAFERKFNLADHVHVTGADLNNGMLTVSLVKEIPEAAKPRRVEIQQNGSFIEHEGKKTQAA